MRPRNSLAVAHVLDLSNTLFPMDGKFHHLAGTYDGAIMNLYLDGVLVGQKAKTGPIPYTSTQPYIGLQPYCRSAADIDEVSFYDRFQTIVSAGSAGKCKPGVASPYSATVLQPIDGDNSSVFTAKRGVVPVKFSLALQGAPTCGLPPATIAVSRLNNSVLQPVDESVYVLAADSGSSFRVSNCQHVYNLSVNSLGVGQYEVAIKIENSIVQTARFSLR